MSGNKGEVIVVDEFGGERYDLVHPNGIRQTGLTAKQVTDEINKNYRSGLNASELTLLRKRGTTLTSASGGWRVIKQ